MTRPTRDPNLTCVEDGRRMLTPLALVLIVIEVTDVLFALDSIPAIFGITHDPFIVYTSNICAILGLRSLYFLLAGVVHKFIYLKPALAIILTFIGAKMLLADIYQIPTAVSLGVVGLVLSTAIGYLYFAIVNVHRPPRQHRNCSFNTGHQVTMTTDTAPPNRSYRPILKFCVLE